VEALESLDYSVNDCGDVFSPPESTEEGGLRNFRPLLKCVSQLRSTVLESLREDRIPIVLGGEHTLAMSGVSAALQHFEGDLGLLWIDAHADINTPGSTNSGNVHGMPVAALAGMSSDTDGKPNEEWEELLTVLGSGPRLDLEATVWYGLRDVDPAERNRLAGLPITMHQIDRYGVGSVVSMIDEWYRKSGVRQLWISFDVDALDPILAPGTGTGVRGGLTYREAHLTAELIRESLDERVCPYRLVGVDVVETNPLYDSRNQTAKMSVEWLSSLFGKTILGKR
jgi:arginase